MIRKECDRTRHGGRLAGRTAVVVCALSALSIAPAAIGQTIRIYPEATTIDAQVRLGDVADVSGCDAQTTAKLRKLILCRSPESGGEQVIDSRNIRDQLAAAGVNLGHVLIKGSTHCRVSRPHDVPDSATTAPANDAEVAPGSCPPPRLGRIIQDYFSDKFAEYGGVVDLQYGRTARDALNLSAAQYTFQIHDHSERPLGLIAIDVDVLEEGRFVQSIPLVLEVSLTVNVAVARRTINRMGVIQSRDVALAPRLFKRLDRIGLRDPNEAIGLLAARMIRSGDMLTSADLKAVPLVKSGDLIHVYHRAGRLEVKTVAKAMQEGSRGDSIEVRSQRSRERFFVTVTGPKTAQIGSKPSGCELAAWRGKG